MLKKRVIVSVINDLVTDQRVHKVSTTLTNMGFEVLLVGRKMRNSLPLEKRAYETHRMNLLFEKGTLFYAEYMLRLFFLLLFKKVDVLVSNDLDTLLPNYFISKIKGKHLVYDTHEIFTEVPELKNAAFKKRIWELVEGFIFPKLKTVFTVNESIANWYKHKYEIHCNVVRNIPFKLTAEKIDRAGLHLPIDKKIIIMQGAGINVQRGAEEAIEAMQYIDNALFLIIGGGDVIETLKQNVKQLKLESKVQFIPKQPYTKLMQYTQCADLGITIDKPTNINYQYSLPNKIFDYIQAGIPVLASKLTEVEKIITTYKVGVLIDNHDPKHIAEKINTLLSNNDLLNTYKQNAKKAASVLTWEQEEQVLKAVYSKLSS